MLPFFAELLAHSSGQTKSQTIDRVLNISSVDASASHGLTAVSRAEEGQREEDAEGDLSTELEESSTSHNLSRVRAHLLWGLKVPVFVNSHLGPIVG